MGSSLLQASEYRWRYGCIYLNYMRYLSKLKCKISLYSGWRYHDVNKLLFVEKCACQWIHKTHVITSVVIFCILIHRENIMFEVLIYKSTARCMEPQCNHSAFKQLSHIMLSLTHSWLEIVINIQTSVYDLVVLGRHGRDTTKYKYELH